MWRVAKVLGLLGVMSVWLAGCSTVEVRTDFDRAVDFSRFSTYAWKQLPNTGNPLLDSRIVSAVDGQLFSKGWKRVSELQAQTVLAASTAVQDRQRIDTFHNAGGPGWHGWGWGGPVMSTSRVVTYSIGTLILDLYDTRTRNAVWRGTASDIVSRDPARVSKALADGVQKMFEGFPPGVVVRPAIN
jgi:hypothetical protein